MVAGFKNALTPELRAAATSAGLTVRQVVTLASLVEKETGTPEERPLVAAVYRNRHEDRHGHAGRPDGDLRAAEGRQVQRQSVGATTCSSTRPTTPIGIRACRRDRSPRPARPRSKPPRSRPTWTTCTSSAGTTARTCSRARSTSTTATFAPGRWSTSGSFGRSAGIGIVIRDPDRNHRSPTHLITRSLSLVPLQLLSQHFEVAARRRTHQPQRPLRARDGDVVALVQREARLAVEGDVDLVAGVRCRSNGRGLRVPAESRSAGWSACAARSASARARPSPDARSARRRQGCRRWIRSAWRRSGRRL